jgi:outer membrane protein TolC
MYKTLLIILIFFIQVMTAENAIIEQFISTALQNNLALKQQDFSYRRSVAALDQARGLFLPSIDINARYSRADGGRIIDIPVDQFLNPIYQTLNALLPQPVFPEDIESQTITFLREKEHETKIRAVQPLFNADIYYNYKIKDKLQQLELTAKQAYARQLIADVKVAYYSYLKSLEIVELLQRTQELLEENLRVNEKLVEIQKSTRDVVYRSLADLSFLEKQQADAEKGRVMSQAYFNFLLNFPQDQAVQITTLDSLPQRGLINLTDAEGDALQNREEINQIGLAIDAAQNGVKLNRSAFLPQIFAVLDYGYQGEFYRFSEEDKFWMASAILQWNLFNGFQDRKKIEQARLDQQRLQTRKAELKEQIRLEVRDAYYSVLVALRNLQSSEDQLTSQQKSFEIIDKRYKQGMALQVEYLDARNSYIRSEIDLIVARFDYYITLATLERTTANYPMPKLPGTK